MIITNGDVTLRPIKNTDNDILYSLINNQDIINSVVGFSFPTNESEHIDWIKKQSENKNNARFMIDFKDQTVGYIGLSNINIVNRSGELGIKILSTKFHGKGIGTNAVQLLVKYAFDYLNLRRIETSILEDNIKSLNLFSKKLNWSYEGKKISSVYRKGTYHNEVLFALINSHYEG